MQLLATNIGWLHITSARHEEAAASGGGGGASLPCPPSFGLGITPPNLYTDELKNYRPVSNLQFVSKIIEKVYSTCNGTSRRTHCGQQSP